MKLKELLALRITSGEFTFGDRFPGLHQLCEEYGISYVTVNKTMKMLVKEGYLQARNGVGYFVCYVPSNTIATRKIVNFITGLDKTHPMWPFIHEGKDLFVRAGWEVNIHCFANNEISNCVPLLNSPDAYNVLFFSFLQWENFIATFDHVVQRTVVLGVLADNEEISCIISDEYATVRKCLDYFKARGRKRTGLICGSLSYRLEKLRIAAWRMMMEAEGFPHHELNDLYTILGNIDVSQKSEAKRSCMNWLQKNKGKIDSLIIPHLHADIIDACLEVGLRIPEDIDILGIAWPTRIEHKVHMPLIENNLVEHFKTALAIIEERFKTGKKDPCSWYFCPPGKYIE